MIIKLIHKTIAFIVVMNLTKSERAAQKKRKDPGFHGEEMMQWNDSLIC
jgi:hypothetical protein